MLDRITPLIVTYNEELNIERVLKKLSWAKEIIVVDSFSDDRTTAIAAQFSAVHVVQRKFDSHSNQWNFALSLSKTDWVLTLDADYVLTDNLIREISGLEERSGVDGYTIRFQYCVSGVPLRATILPPRTALFKKSKGVYIQDGHTQRLVLNGCAKDLQFCILHDDRKPFRRWFASQKHYAALECGKLRGVPSNQLSVPDRVRKWIFPAPPMVFFYCLLYKGLILDGWRGFFYTFQRVLAEILLSLRLIECQSGFSKKDQKK